MSITAKEKALELVTQAKEQWRAGSHDRALDLMNDAKEALVRGGYHEKNLPGIFGYVDHLRKTLAEFAAERGN